MFRPNPITSFTEEILDLGLASVGSLTVRHYSRLTQSANQSESRTPLSAFGLYSLDLGGVVLEDSKAQYVFDFLHARRGRTQGFRIRVPSDYQLTQPLYSRYEPSTGTYVCRYAQLLPEISNAGTIYRIYRIIQTRSLTGKITKEEKPIFKPRPGSIRLINGVTGALIPSNQWLIDYTSGQIVFPGGFPSFPVVPLGEFDIPVRVGEEENPFTLNASISRQFDVLPDLAPPIGNILAKGILCNPHVNRLSLDNLKLVEFVPQFSELAFVGQEAFTGVGNIYSTEFVNFSAVCNGEDLQISWTFAPVNAVTTNVLVNGNLTHSLGVGASTIIAPTVPATLQLVFLDSEGSVISQSQQFSSGLVCSGGGPTLPLTMVVKMWQFNTPIYDGNTPSALFEVSPPPSPATILRVTQGVNVKTLPYVEGFNYWVRGVTATAFKLEWLNGSTVLDEYTTSAYVGPVSGYNTTGQLSQGIARVTYAGDLGLLSILKKVSATYGYASEVQVSQASYPELNNNLFGVAFNTGGRQIGGFAPNVYPIVTNAFGSSNIDRVELKLTAGEADLSVLSSVYTNIEWWVNNALTTTLSTPYGSSVAPPADGYQLLKFKIGANVVGSSQVWYGTAPAPTVIMQDTFTRSGNLVGSFTEVPSTGVSYANYLVGGNAGHVISNKVEGEVGTGLCARLTGIVLPTSYTINFVVNPERYLAFIVRASGAYPGTRGVWVVLNKLASKVTVLAVDELFNETTLTTINGPIPSVSTPGQIVVTPTTIQVKIPSLSINSTTNTVYDNASTSAGLYIDGVVGTPDRIDSWEIIP